MRHVAIASLCVLFLACSKEEQAGVKVVIEYTPSFKTGCFTVQAYDAAKLETELQRVDLTNLSRGSPLSVAILRKEGWGEKIRLVVTAREQTCDGPQVDQKLVDLELGGAGVQAEQKVTLTTPDEDDDGYVASANGGTDCDDRNKDITQRRYYRDADGDQVGTGAAVLGCTPPQGHVAASGDCNDAAASIRPGATETCNEADDNCDDQTDEGFENVKQWYLDDDGDMYGRNETATVTCTRPSAKHVQRTGDCDDARADVRPGVTEVCNNRDDNCANGTDEGFNKGGTCTDGQNCAGTLDCLDTGTVPFCKTPPRDSYYPDEDEDGQGAVGSTAVQVCSGAPRPTKTAAAATDCDDLDDDTNVGAMEVCDALDNNCAGGVDEGLTCNGALRQVTDAAVGVGSHDWRTVALGPNNGYPVWIAGDGGKLARRENATSDFVSHSYGDVPANTTNCGEYDWYAAWVGPNGHVYLAGEDGRVAEHTGSACISQATAPSSNNITIRGIVGFETGTTLYLVNDDGRLLSWIPGNNPVERDNTSNNYYALHALNPNLLLVGGRTGGSPGTQHIVDYFNGDLTANRAHTLGPPVPIANVFGIWMNSPSLAYAVGDENAIWKWNGDRAWSLVTPPAAGGGSFSSVAMPPGLDIIYVVDYGSAGKFHRRTPFGWARTPVIASGAGSGTTSAGVPLRDIAMSSVSNFWMVGDDGRVYHYPEP